MRFVFPSSRPLLGMAGTPPEQPWSNHEKVCWFAQCYPGYENILTWIQNYLLAEIIKNANLHPQVLFDVLRSYNIQPRWEEIPLPPGKHIVIHAEISNMNQSML